MSKKESVDKNKENMDDIKKVIEETSKETVKECLDELRNRNMIKSEMSYYKRVELLLYNYNSLKEAVKQKDEDIADLEKHGLQQKSGSVVVYSSSGGGISAEDRYLQLIEKYRMEKKETERDIRRIDAALKKIKKDKYYKIIDMKYINKKDDKIVTDEYIAEVIGKDRGTIIRNRKRLMNKLITVLFPQSIRDII